MGMGDLDMKLGERLHPQDTLATGKELVRSEDSGFEAAEASVFFSSSCGSLRQEMNDRESFRLTASHPLRPLIVSLLPLLSSLPSSMPSKGASHYVCVCALWGKKKDER